ncbi:MAG: hypothetical protein V4734_13355, partial [Terriglobus sp.]
MRSRLLALAFAALVAVPSFAAGSAKSPDTKLANHVKADMDFLASDTLHGRGSMTRDEHLAAQYCAT